MAALVRRDLRDLWVVGRELVLDDGQGEPITVWLQKLNPVEATTASRRSDAARARIMAVRFDEESDEYQATRASVLDYGDAKVELVNFLLIEDRGRLERAQEAQTAAEEEWSKDNYLQGLRDAWNGDGDTPGLSATHVTDPDDPETKRVWDELSRFTEIVTTEVDGQLEAIREVKMESPIDEIRTEVIARLIKMESNQAWLDELRRCEIFFGTRRADNHGQRVFNKREEVDSLSGLTYRHLREAYEGMEVDVAEGKDSPAATVSSPSSVPQNGAETGASSGPVAASQ